MNKRSLIVLFSILILIIVGCQKSNNKIRQDFTDFSELSNKRIGVFTGTVHDAFLEVNYPQVAIYRYDNTSDMVLSLRTNRIDAAMLDLISAGVLLRTTPGLKILTDDILTLPLGVGFRKDNPELKKKFNSFLVYMKESGIYAEMYNRWFIEDAEKAKMPDITYPRTGPKIKVGVAVGDLPYVAYVNNDYVGFDIEMLKRFAKHEGFNFEFITMDFAALVMSLASGRVDIIADGIAITDERKERVNFSDPYLDFKTAVLVMDQNYILQDNGLTNRAIPGSAFFSSVKKSFHSNIIHENRYKLLFEGLKTTLIISFLATIFGTLMGSFVCFLRMSKIKMLNKIARIFISTLRGTPVLVFLMIIFYVVFASVNIDPIFVAVLAFGLNFAAYASEMFRTGIESIDRGQTEAGIAMGFTKISTFTNIILPQAVRRILPVYQGEVVSLIKMTSIVGYIAVQDLTKASDIIRSRTFDAFFPLIAVAFIYFIICWAVMAAMDFWERKTNKRLAFKKGR